MGTRKHKKQTDHWGKRLSQILKEKKLSIRQAARICGVSHSVIDSWTGGAAPNDLMAVKRLCDHVSCSFSWILTGEPEKNSSQPPLAELFEEVKYFDGLARIRIDRLIPRQKILK